MGDPHGELRPTHAPMNVASLSPLAIALSAASMLLATGAHAQSAACEDFRNKLIARVDPGITAFTLDIVRSNVPLPPDAKVFGTCDGGAYKLLFQRGGSTRTTPAAAASAAAPASAAAQGPAKPVVTAASAPGPAPLPRPKEPASAPTSPPAPQPAKPVSTSASPVVAASAAVPVTPPPAVVRTPDEEEAVAVQATSEPQGPGFLGRNWLWLCALLLLLPAAAGLWAWCAHRNAYDEAGLPRGPRL
jgi:Protein of unknown function (DUF1161)